MAAGRLETTVIGARIRSTRRRLGLKRRPVAANAGLSRRRLAKFERGRAAMSVDDVRSVAGSLGVDISELVDVDHEDDNTTDAMLDTEPSPSDIRIDDLFDTAPF